MKEWVQEVGEENPFGTILVSHQVIHTFNPNGMYVCSSVSSRHFINRGHIRVLEMLRRGSINHQAMHQNKVKI